MPPPAAPRPEGGVGEGGVLTQNVLEGGVLVVLGQMEASPTSEPFSGSTPHPTPRWGLGRHSRRGWE